MTDDRSTMNRLTPAFGGFDYARPEHDSKLGGQFAWFWGVPAVFHALAAPNVDHPLPAPPTDADDHAQRLGYWGALHYLLLRRLGWQYPASGLTWWYDSDKPTDDPTLALVQRGWGREGQLDSYLAWLLNDPRRFDLAAQPPVSWSENAPAPPEHWTRWSHERLRACLVTCW